MIKFVQYGQGVEIRNLVGVNIIDYITIASTGNAVDFGDLSAHKNYICFCSSSTRGILEL